MSRIRKIIHKYFDVDHPEDIRKKFANWFNNPSGRVEKQTALKAIWDRLEVEPDIFTEISYASVQGNIRTTMLRRRLYKLSRIAAIFLLPILSVAITYFVMKNYNATTRSVDLVECIVPNGEIRTVTLPDSSVVKINSGSILIYPKQFTSRRDVFLNGEAYFIVARDEAKPFTVKTTDMIIEVLGTVFNVSSYIDSETSSATLESGHVSVAFRNGGAPVVLRPNERVSYNRPSGSIEKSRVKIENVTAWTKGNLVIQSMAMDEIARIIERKYGMTVNMNSHKYRNERITMKANNGEDITAFMNVLTYLIPQLTYRIENDTLYIY